MKDELEAAKTALDVVGQIEKILEKLGPFKPDLKSLTVDYLTKQSVMKLLLNVPRSIKRKVRRIEMPAYQGYYVDEVFDEAFNKVVLPWRSEDGMIKLDARALPSSEKYFVTLKGSISQSALDELVVVHCPEDPKRTEENDSYWIHSAIKDMGFFEDVYQQLSVEKVSTCVKVGVERSFSSSIPRNVRIWVEARARADLALDSADRQKLFGSWRTYRMARRGVGRISASDILRIVKRLLSPEIFLVFIAVDDPYRIEGIPSFVTSGLVPDVIGIDVQTDLNFDRPAADGNLTFMKEDFARKISEEFNKSLEKRGSKFR